MDRSQCAADIIFWSGFGKSEMIWQHKIFWNVTKCKIVFKDSSWFVFIWCHHSYIHLINCGKVKSIETIWTPDSTFLGLLAHPSVGRAGQTNYMGGSQKAFLCQFLPFKPPDCRYFFHFICVSVSHGCDDKFIFIWYFWPLEEIWCWYFLWWWWWRWWNNQNTSR